ncbi:hypothetical protein RhiirB3_445813 [Rhizophagus irregularis]|nr:hypothetical protein RhiirB3_445813 [Rhizophagus irregularis]
MEIPIFYGEIGEDPKEWTNQVEKYLSKIGIKDDKRIFEIAKIHLLGNALQWLENEGMCIVNWNKNEIKWLNLKFRIIDKYSRKGFIRINSKVKCKYCKKIEEVTLEEINYFEVREESKESLRNKIEMLCNEYFQKGMKYLNEYEERCEHKDMNISQMGELIKVICEHYILSEDNEFILDDQKEENLLENKELLTYRYIIEDDELDIRFAKFEEWLEEIESITIKKKGYSTMRYFKKILHLEENIAEEENREEVKKFQKSITYQWWDGNNYPKPWINDDVTDKIIEKIVETKGFVEEYCDVGELESSDDMGESSSNKGNKYIEKIYRN